MSEKTKQRKGNKEKKDKKRREVNQ